jgi:hypothetical protein
VVKRDIADMTLLEATKCNHIDVGLFTWKAWNDLNKSDEHNRIDLSWMTANGCTETARSLLEFNVGPDPKNEQGYPPYSTLQRPELQRKFNFCSLVGFFELEGHLRPYSAVMAAGKNNQIVV